MPKQFQSIFTLQLQYLWRGMEASILVPLLVVLSEVIPQMTWNYNQTFTSNICTPPAAHSLPPLFLQMKGVDLLDMSCKFDLHLTCNFRVFIFVKFSYKQKVPFYAASRWFFGRNPPKSGENGFKFWTVMQCKVMHQICDQFYFIVKKWSRISQKTDFLEDHERPHEDI